MLKSVETCNITLDAEYQCVIKDSVNGIILASAEYYWPYSTEDYWPYGNYHEFYDYILADLTAIQSQPGSFKETALYVYYIYDDNIYYAKLFDNSKFIQVVMKSASAEEKIQIKRKVLQLNFPSIDFTPAPLELINWCFKEEAAHSILRVQNATLADVEKEYSRRYRKHNVLL